jgi:hypothetical protein
MRASSEAFEGEGFVQQVAARSPWSQPCVLLDKVEAPGERERHARKAIERGWGRAVLVPVGLGVVPPSVGPSHRLFK